MMSAGPNVFGVVKDGGVCFFPLVQGACNKLNTPCHLGDTSSNRISAQIAFFARVTLDQ